jgi:hypothetical protein
VIPCKFPSPELVLNVLEILYFDKYNTSYDIFMYILALSNKMRVESTRKNQQARVSKKFNTQ